MPFRENSADEVRDVHAHVKERRAVEEQPPRRGSLVQAKDGDTALNDGDANPHRKEVKNGTQQGGCVRSMRRRRTQTQTRVLLLDRFAARLPYRAMDLRTAQVHEVEEEQPEDKPQLVRARQVWRIDPEALLWLEEDVGDRRVDSWVEQESADSERDAQAPELVLEELPRALAIQTRRREVRGDEEEERHEVRLVQSNEPTADELEHHQRVIASGFANANRRGEETYPGAFITTENARDVVQNHEFDEHPLDVVQVMEANRLGLGGRRLRLLLLFIERQRQRCLVLLLFFLLMSIIIAIRQLQIARIVNRITTTIATALAASRPPSLPQGRERE